MSRLLLILSLSIATESLSKEIYESDEWRALLHVNENNQSEVTDTKFFISSGAFSPQKEYDAFLSALKTDNRCNTICQFPARSRFLKKQLDLDLTFDHCADFNGYMAESNGESVSVVLVSSFLGSPASYFGHSFIKINKLQNLHFSHTIGFTADMPSNSSFQDLFFNTLIGGLEGHYIYAPYYQLLEQYSAIEQRSLVEYKLNLSNEELDNLRWHAYELHNIKTGYKVLSRNCAYELLWLLEVARPTVRLREHFNYYAVPSETMDVLKTQKLVESISTRPSDIDSMYSLYRILSDREKDFFSDWKRSDSKIAMLAEADFNTTSKQTLAYILNTNYDVEFKKYRNPDNDFSEVKKIRYQNPMTDYIGEPYKNLHPSKISLGRIVNDDGIGTQFQLQPVLFNRYDERKNELSEETLEILSLNANYQQNNLFLESLDVLKIESLTRRYDFFAPLSWKFYLGANRSLQDRSLQPAMEVASGLSYGTKDGLIYCLIQPAIYPLAFTAGVSVVSGISYWIESTHVGLDFKDNVIYSDLNPSMQREIYLSMPINQSVFLRSYYDFHHQKTYAGITYRF